MKLQQIEEKIKERLKSNPPKGMLGFGFLVNDVLTEDDWNLLKTLEAEGKDMEEWMSELAMASGNYTSSEKGYIQPK